MISLNDYLYNGDTVFKILKRYSSDLKKAKEILMEKEIEVLVGLGSGDASATAWGCDLTYDYVRINGDYRS